MDQIDAKLITLLQQNARVSLKELAKKFSSPLRPYLPALKTGKGRRYHRIQRKDQSG